MLVGLSETLPFCKFAVCGVVIFGLVGIVFLLTIVWPPIWGWWCFVIVFIFIYLLLVGGLVFVVLSLCFWGVYVGVCVCVWMFVVWVLLLFLLFVCCFVFVYLCFCFICLYILVVRDLLDIPPSDLFGFC
jgi:hypothetical protein